MTGPRAVAHVFPYDPRHLGQTFERWTAGQLERWPLAAVRRSALAPRSRVHTIGPRPRRTVAGPLEIVSHAALASGPRFRDWGDDWSLGLERALRRLGPQDACVVHLNDYPSARLAQRSAGRARVVLVFHGRGLGRYDEHLAAADLLVVLREDAADALRAEGAPPEQVAVVAPSVERARFAARGDSLPTQTPVRLGFVGRLEESKGVRELPRVVRRLADEGIDARVELAGPFTPAQRAALEEGARADGVDGRLELLGELPQDRLAERMAEWRLLLMPSYTEGHPLTALEALAARVPVAAVSGVAPAELERRPGFSTSARERYADLVAALVREERRPPPADWVLDHEQGAARWDALLRELRPWRPRPSVPVSRLARARRLRPPRRLARALLRRQR